ncbi:HEAT repeat-containing protein 3 [Prorops nasuta]|uniref:HEAT repeat-containing protein 3 n=1 Tax=Prorops nasuta TaxID=863751 RepID=UPI0034CFDEFF
MGKLKRSKQKAHKKNPTGLMSVKDFEDETENFTDDDKEKALLRVYEEVQSVNIEEKISGLQMLESMACDAAMAVRIAKDGISKMIGSFLVDCNISVRVAVATTLRYIVENGGEEALNELLKDDILTPLTALLKKYNTEIQFKEKHKLDDERECFIQGVTLLWSLAEKHESVIELVNKEDLTNILIRYLNISVYDLEIVIVVSQCLLVLSEDNEPAVNSLKQCENTLLNLLDLKQEGFPLSDVILLKTLAAGLLINIKGSSQNDSLQLGCKIISILSTIIETEYISILDNLIPELKSQETNLSNTTKKKVQDLRKILGALQQALELVANLCSCDEESDADSDSCIDDEEEDMGNVFDTDSTNSKVSTIVSHFPVQFVEAINSSNLVNIILQKTASIQKDVETVLKKSLEGNAVIKQIHTLRCRAYISLSNLMSSLEIDALGGIDNLYSIWLKTGTVVFQEIQPNDIELLEAATSLIRVSLQQLVGAEANILKQLTVNDIHPMLNGERQCPDPYVRVNLLRSLGSLAMLLVEDKSINCQEVVERIILFVLESCTKEVEVWVMAEAIDAIIDIFAEDTSNRMIAELNLLEKMKQIHAIFKAKIRQQKKDLYPHKAIVSTVCYNMERFMTYKRKQLMLEGYAQVKAPFPRK